MGQILHGNARTMEAAHRTIQHRQKCLKVVVFRKHKLLSLNNCLYTCNPQSPSAPVSLVSSLRPFCIFFLLRTAPRKTTLSMRLAQLKLLS
ncbi:hypothetical protein SAMN05421754_102627 [Nitrosomonas sp. Nm58]|nr:hypothetical protein SAMN05421754_102627 [Nitrosomonas sp. Nm58]